MKKSILLVYQFVFIAFLIHKITGNPDITNKQDISYNDEECVMQNTPSTNTDHHANIKKYTLKNGLTILVRVVKTIPKVSMQMWYYVGSKDEENGERGIAHLIEHMIFKGTKKLSESDINFVVHKLSGNCNAFTSYDYTGYLFNMPTHHWKQVLPIIADCMTNARFDQQMLNSEMKAVIQELKMYKDLFVRSLIEEMVSVIFSDHPYHYPIIGYKQDLWNADSELLKSFYKKHYKPNNATFVIVGDVDPEQVYQETQKHFESIEPDTSYTRNTYYFNDDVVSKSINIYRDVKVPTTINMFLVPGSAQKQDHVLRLLEWVLARGKSSRLYKKLVDEQKLVTSIQAGTDNLFDHSLFYIAYNPKNIADIPKIDQCIFNEINDIKQNGFTQQELRRAFNKTRMSLYNLLEDIEHQAYAIGEYFLATGQEDYIFNSMEQDYKEVQQQALELLKKYFRATIMHRGNVFALPEEEKKHWNALQTTSDKLDEEILSAHVRTLPVEEPRYANTITPTLPKFFDFAKAKTTMLSNGIKVLSHHNPNTPKISLIVDLKSQSYDDPEEQLGIGNFVSMLLSEGTTTYSATEFAQAIEERGMSLSVCPGTISISLLKEDLPFALDIINDILHNALFDKHEIEKVRDQLLTTIDNFWDEPRSFIGQLVREALYSGHPYSKNRLGTKEIIKNLQRDNLVNYYKKFMSPDGARIAVVGDIADYNVTQLLEDKLGSWQGEKIADIVYPALPTEYEKEIIFPINRDQVVLAFAKHSIARNDKDYDKYLLFNQIFGGGVLGSMSSRLFQLREQTGLFYGINGSALAATDKEPGMLFVQTMVSGDRLAEAEKIILQTINTVVDTITQDELDEAKRAIINSMVDNFASNNSLSNTFLYLDYHNLPQDYFDTRASKLEKITLNEVKTALKNLMTDKKLLVVKAGRL
jgi:zinc protease